MAFRKLTALVWIAAGCFAQPAAIRFENGAFRVTPGRGDLSVFAGEADSPAMLGSTRMDGDTLVFIPRFPPRPGIVCRVVFKAASGEIAEQRVIIPGASGASSTRLDHVYPSTDRIPENQLKFYLQFSGPMSRGEAYQRIRLVDDAGKPVELPFLELDQELWDPSGSRLTLFFDPGRVKREVMPNREVGAPMVVGHVYTLQVDRAWLDATGQPMTGEFRKTFRVVAADRTSPRPTDWKIQTPSAGSRDPLVIRFPEPLDYALLAREIEAPAPGKITVDEGETRWSMIPDAPWKAGVYSIEIGTALEDLAGNRIDRLFDVDKFNRVERARREVRRLRFRVR